MKIKLKPINSRFKRLIHDFGSDWVATSDPRPMSCFDGALGVTCAPAIGARKFSNFRCSDVEVIPDHAICGKCPDKRLCNFFGGCNEFHGAFA